MGLGHETADAHVLKHIMKAKQVQGGLGVSIFQPMSSHNDFSSLSSERSGGRLPKETLSFSAVFGPEGR